MKLLLPFLLLSLSAFVFAQTPDKNEASILGTVSDLVTAQTAYDLKTIDRILSPDYIEISPVGEFDPRAKVLSFYSPEAKSAAATVSAKVSVAEPSVRVYGNVAVAIVKLEYTMTANGKPLPPRAIRATYVLRRSEKDWKIASAQYTGIRPLVAKPA